MGYTGICPWQRISWGFWELKRPKVCCGRLGWDDLQLLVLTCGRVEDEKYIQRQVPPECGEFWHRKDLEALCSAMESLVYTKYVHGDNEWKLPLPPRPDAPPLGKRSHPFQNSPCCHGGPIQQRRLIPDKKLKCWFCGSTVKRSLLRKHYKTRMCQNSRPINRVGLTCTEHAPTTKTTSTAQSVLSRGERLLVGAVSQQCANSALLIPTPPDSHAAPSAWQLPPQSRQPGCAHRWCAAFRHPWPGARASPWTLPQAPHGDRAAAQRALSRSPVAQRLAYRLRPPHLGRSACSPSVLAEAGLWWNCSGLLPALPCNDRCSPSGIAATYSETPREQSAAFFREVWSGLCHMHGYPYRRH